MNILFLALDINIKSKTGDGFIFSIIVGSYKTSNIQHDGDEILIKPNPEYLSKDFRFLTNTDESTLKDITLGGVRVFDRLFFIPIHNLEDTIISMEPNIYPKHIISGFDKICDKELELLDEDERDELINKFEKEMWPGTVFVTALRNSIDSLLYKFNNFPDFPDDAFTIVQKLDRNKKIRENETSEDIKNFLINKEIVGNKKGLLAFKEFDKILSGPLLKVNELIRNADTNIVEQADELNNIEIGDSKIHIRVQYTGEARTRAEYVKRFTKCLGWIRSNEIQTYEEGGKLYAKK